jgi:hypothetical protein
MATHDLTIESTPTGIPVQVTREGNAYWISTPTTITCEDDEELTIKGKLDYVESNTGYAFTSWTIGGGSSSTNILQEITMDNDYTYTALYTETAYYPVRDPARRASKYEAKNDEEVAAIRTTALKPMMVSQVKVTATEQVELERTVARILHATGIPGIFIHHYRNFSQELYSLKKRFTSESLNTEGKIIAEKWVTRGLDPDLLTEIATVMQVTIDLT